VLQDNYLNYRKGPAAARPGWLIRGPRWGSVRQDDGRGWNPRVIPPISVIISRLHRMSGNFVVGCRRIF
jgi:hypothetical protein